MDVFGATDLVAPLLGADVHAGVQVVVVEHHGVGVQDGPHGRAAAVGQDGAEHLPVPVEALHLLLNDGDGWGRRSGGVSITLSASVSYKPLIWPTEVIHIR